MKDGIERGLNEYADVAAEIEDVKRDPDVLKQMYDGREHWVLDESGRSIAEKRNRLRGERIQEIIEKDLNERLTKVEDIELKAQVGGLGVTKSEVTYNGDPITVYNMRGASLKMLTSSISYKDTVAEICEGNAIGAMAMNTLEVMPAVWMENEQRMIEHNEAVRRFGKRGNTLSCSYTDVNKNPDRRLGTNLEMMTEHKKEPYIVYGWDHVRPGSVMEVANTDLNTPQIISKKGYISLSESELDIWDKLENDTAKVKGSYNEVAKKRFDDEGNAIPPDYLAIENSEISEDIKHHAWVHKVPIINVERLGESLEADGALESEK